MHKDTTEAESRSEGEGDRRRHRQRAWKLHSIWASGGGGTVVKKWGHDQISAEKAI
jgi:hypothetical protein